MKFKALCLGFFLVLRCFTSAVYFCPGTSGVCWCEQRYFSSQLRHYSQLWFAAASGRSLVRTHHSLYPAAALWFHAAEVLATLLIPTR